MKNGGKTKSVAFIILVSIYIYKICVCMCYDVTGLYSETNKTETKDAHDQSISLSFAVCFGLLSANLLASVQISMIHIVIITNIQYTCSKCKNGKGVALRKRKQGNIAVAVVVAFLCGYAHKQRGIAILQTTLLPGTTFAVHFPENNGTA